MASPVGWADWLGVVGSVASLASFAAAGYAAVKVREIGRRILFNVWAEEVVREVEASSGSFTNSLQTYPDDRMVMEKQLRVCLAQLQRIKADVSSDAREPVKQARKLADRYFSGRNAEGADGHADERLDLLWELNAQIAIAVGLIKHSIAERRLGGRDGRQ